MTCDTCGYPYRADGTAFALCPLCAGKWEIWELLFSPLPLLNVTEQVAAWLGQVPYPAAIELVATVRGVKVRLYLPPGKGGGVVNAWAALTKQQSRWRKIPSLNEVRKPKQGENGYILCTPSLLPALAVEEGDLFLALCGQLISQVSGEQKEGSHMTPDTVALRIWLLGKETKLQERLRALSAYATGTEKGVEDDAPNPWSLRLALWRALLMIGGFVAAISGGLLATNWVARSISFTGLLAGALLFFAAYLGLLAWMRWRSIPKETLERAVNGPLLKVAFSITSPQSLDLELLAGEQEWKLLKGVRDRGWVKSAVSGIGSIAMPEKLTPTVVPNHDTEKPDTRLPEWPAIKAFTMPLPDVDLARLVAPPEEGEGMGILDPETRQDVPAPPPSRALIEAPFKIGISVTTGEDVGIDPDGHGMAIGGSRTGKSSFVFRLLRQMAEQGEAAPGLFLVDPHASLADGFLHTIDQLPAELRAEAIRRLRVITPDQPEVVPLNLLTLPDFSWAGNAIVQAGRRIWDDYWGPRMQAALLGLFKLAHAWNRHHADRQMGLLHTVFAAFNVKWRHHTLGYLSPAERLGSLALDALLGQTSTEPDSWSQKWATEVVSPVLSKAMALELSPWLFAAMHQPRFVDMEQWVQNRCWVVLRLPSGTMGREGARLTAGIVYNIFEAVFRRVTLAQPIPFYFLIDEAQEIAGGMQLEAMLSEGAKFGARIFVLAQSLSLHRRVEGFEPVVQALLANTSTQAFFSPDPEDADLVRATLSSTVRYGQTTLDIPSLQAWLRARLHGRWQPPTLVRIEPLVRADPERVQRVIREVITAHREDYAPGEGWQRDVVQAMKGLVPKSVRGLLGKLVRMNDEFENPDDFEDESPRPDESLARRRRTGW